MIITKQIEIDMGHRVPNHKSKCKTPHGHRYKIEVGIDDFKNLTPGASDEGMVVDYSDLKEILMEVIDKPYDHSGVFYNQDPKREAIEEFYEGSPKEPIFVSFIPTAENLAQWWFILLKKQLKNINYVTVWETPTSTATYKE